MLLALIKSRVFNILGTETDPPLPPWTHVYFDEPELREYTVILLGLQE